MVGFITGDIQTDPTAQQIGAQDAPSSAFEGQDWLGITERGAGRDYRQQVYEAANDRMPDPKTGYVPPAPEMMSGADADKQYRIGDMPSFGDKPVPKLVAQSLAEQKQGEIWRQDAAARRPDGFWNGAARLGVGFVAGALDPVNVAAMFLPVAGEARLSAGAADVFGEGAAAMAARRAVVGAAAGAQGMVPVTAAHLALAQESGEDYGPQEALSDIAFGAAFGAVAHNVAGTAGDVLGRFYPKPPAPDPIDEAFRSSPEAQMLAQNPELNAAANKTAIAHTLLGQPVEVRPLFALPDVVSWQNRIASAQARMSAMAREEAALRGEAEGIGAPDAMTQARIDAIDDELTQPGSIGSDRMQQLETERQMLTEGQQPKSDLEQARDEAQRQGLLTAADRYAQQQKDMGDQIERTRAYLRGEWTPETQARVNAAEAAVKEPVEPGGRPDDHEDLREWAVRSGVETRSAAEIAAEAEKTEATAGGEKPAERPTTEAAPAEKDTLAQAQASAPPPIVHDPAVTEAAENLQRAEQMRGALMQAATCLMRGNA